MNQSRKKRKYEEISSNNEEQILKNIVHILTNSPLENQLCDKVIPIITKL